MIEINADKALDALRQAVVERGAGYIYTTPNGTEAPDAECVNWWSKESFGPEVEEGPACIVGLTLHNLGIDMSGHEDGTADAVAHRLQRGGVARISPVAVLMLSVAQRVQDKGSTWGTAEAVATTVFAQLVDENGKEKL